MADPRAEWLASLKVGDTVGIEWERFSLEIGTVTKITPSRRITIGVNADGDPHPRPDRWSRRDTIHKPAEAFMARIAWRDNETLRVELSNRLYNLTSADAPKGFDHATHNAALQACLDALRSKP